MPRVSLTDKFVAAAKTEVDAHVKLTFEQLAVGRGGDEVYPELLGRGAANGFVGLGLAVRGPCREIRIRPRW